MARQAAKPITTSVPIYCLLAVAVEVCLGVTAFYSDLPPQSRSGLSPAIASSQSYDHHKHATLLAKRQLIDHDGTQQKYDSKQYKQDFANGEKYPDKKKSDLKKKRKSFARQLKNDDKYEATPHKAECKLAMEAVKDTISEWDKLIGTVRSSLGNGQIKVKATVRNNLQRTLNTLQGYSEGARQALDKGNLRDVNRNCRKAGFELARLAVNKEVARSEPQLEANVRKARQIYKSYRKACGGPAY